MTVLLGTPSPALLTAITRYSHSVPRVWSESVISLSIANVPPQHVQVVAVVEGVCHGCQYNARKWGQTREKRLIPLHRRFSNQTAPPLAARGRRSGFGVFRGPEASLKAPWTATEVPWAPTEAPWARTEAPGAATEVPWASLKVPGAPTEVPGARTEAPWASPEALGSSPEHPGASLKVPRVSLELSDSSSEEGRGARGEKIGIRKSEFGRMKLAAEVGILSTIH